MTRTMEDALSGKLGSSGAMPPEESAVAPEESATAVEPHLEVGFDPLLTSMGIVHARIIGVERKDGEAPLPMILSAAYGRSLLARLAGERQITFSQAAALDEALRKSHLQETVTKAEVLNAIRTNQPALLELLGNVCGCFDEAAVSALPQTGTELFKLIFGNRPSSAS